MVKTYIFVYICIVDGDPITKGKALGSHNPVYFRHISIPVCRGIFCDQWFEVRSGCSCC